MKYHFGGFVTKPNIKCSDGRTIMHTAFKKMHGVRVPLVWEHQHNSPLDVLGSAILEHRGADGVYGYCVFNDTDAGVAAKQLVVHGDVESLSIWANQLIEQNSNVHDGVIKEVSLCLSGANPGAQIDNVWIEHSDNGKGGLDKTSAIINFFVEPDDLEGGDFELQHSDSGNKPNTDSDLEAVIATMSEDQKNVLYTMVAAAAGLEHSDGDDTDDNHIEHGGDGQVKVNRNVFEQAKGGKGQNGTKVLTHSELSKMMSDAQKNQVSSLKGVFMAHADTYGIKDIESLFPDAKASGTPEFVKRDTGWVDKFMSKVSRTPMGRFKARYADITEDEARAKGYTKGSLKKEEVFKLLSRSTSPTMIYKKQKLDRQDIIDITDFNVVAWIKGEMRIMLDEEVARACVIGDGRAYNHADKVNEECLKPIYKDDDFYAPKVVLTAATKGVAKIDEIIKARSKWKGTGSPTLWTTTDELTAMLLVRDGDGRRMYRTVGELCTELRVKEIVEVDVMEGINRTVDTKKRNLVGIMFNPVDYKIGADKGGKIGTFEDFDIDYNQYKYLMETYISGMLTKPASALVIEQFDV